MEKKELQGILLESATQIIWNRTNFLLEGREEEKRISVEQITENIAIDLELKGLKLSPEEKDQLKKTVGGATEKLAYEIKSQPGVIEVLEKIEKELDIQQVKGESAVTILKSFSQIDKDLLTKDEEEVLSSKVKAFGEQKLFAGDKIAGLLLDMLDPDKQPVLCNAIESNSVKNLHDNLNYDKSLLDICLDFFKNIANGIAGIFINTEQKQNAGEYLKENVEKFIPHIVSRMNNSQPNKEILR